MIRLQSKSPLLFEDGFHICARSEDRPPFFAVSHTSAPGGGDGPSLSSVPFYSIDFFLCPASCVLESGELLLRPFDILFLTPDAPRRFTFMEENARRITVLFLPAPPDSPFGSDHLQLLDLLSRNGPVYRLPAEDMKTLFSYLNGIFDAAEDPSPLRDLALHMKFTGFLFALYSLRDRNTCAGDAPPDPSARKMHDVAAYIRRHYAEPLTLSDIAAKFYISSFYLSHRFRDVVGVTLSDYIREIRIRNVQTLLVTGSVPITEAAMRCGFTSFSQFNRSFRAAVGMSPSRYRRLMSPDSLSFGQERDIPKRGRPID